MRTRRVFSLACLIMLSGLLLMAQKPATTAGPKPDLPHVPKTPKPPKPPKLSKQEIEKPAPRAQAGEIDGSETVASPAPAVKIATLVWGAPLPIKQGQRLSAAVVHATVDAPGTITYTPPLNFAPPRGLCIVTARFIPSEPSQYKSATATVTVTVE
jgi:hypothetical protein